MSEEVKFVSPRRLSMTVVVVPDQWREIQTPVGAKMVQATGKTIQFLNGIYKTSDPEVIEYLESKYNDSRFPILSDRQMKSMATPVAKKA